MPAMSRTERLFDLLQALRRQRRAVSAQVLARETGVSLRTVYRDIASLQAQGAEIEGAPGVGYVMKPGFLLPPLKLRMDEVDALVLGMRSVADRGDWHLADAALAALAKIAAVLPPELRHELQESALLVARNGAIPQDAIAPDLLRRAVREERKLHLHYRDGAGAPSQRVVWPFALAYHDQARVLMAWCELRGDFRNFRTDRIAEAELLPGRSPKRRAALLKAWRRTRPDAGASILPETDRGGA